MESIIDRNERYDGRRGRGSYNTEQIYRWLYTNSDYNGFVIYTQTEVARLIGIPYQTLSTIYSDFITIGYMKKINSRTFEIVHDPDDLEWDEAYLKKMSGLRKQYQTTYGKQARIIE
jgi:hypothetical protein